MQTDRRALLGLSLGAAAVPSLAQAAQSRPTAPIWPPVESFKLWPGLPPGAPARMPRITPDITERGDIRMRGTASPDVGVFRPLRPDGRAVLIAPGGGYSFVSLENEGVSVARVLAQHGITSFVLNYRLPGDGWRDRADTPLADAQRAMRLIRAQAARFRIDPARLGVIGFSAGGHLAASLVTQYAAKVYAAVDAADAESARPRFGGLMYAVSNMDPGRSRGGSRANLLGPNPSPAMEARYAADRNIRADTPPLFIMHAEDDPTVPVINGLDLLAYARAARVPAEAHIFQQGGHGFGVGLPDGLPGSLWPQLFIRWLNGALAHA
ncbi:esterase [Sphingomonas sp. Leaf357]|uniref:alpha/beta hydrolase n=1 Tax=Sphingomonas sp. Leaf357 TaxID=1736350 RepID=UPI0006F6757B|nr:alpha/beta hydrolase [Sphingomonas sp. Leaf357]KQS01418.1 esterase [Sphingomonas sp. Leaf357]